MCLSVCSFVRTKIYQKQAIQVTSNFSFWSLPTLKGQNYSSIFNWTIAETRSMFTWCKLCKAQPRKRGALAPGISSYDIFARIWISCFLKRKVFLPNFVVLCWWWWWWPWYRLSGKQELANKLFKSLTWHIKICSRNFSHLLQSQI